VTFKHEARKAYDFKQSRIINQECQLIGSNRMKVKLRIKSDDRLLYEGTYDIRDAESFGTACADAWEKLRMERLEKATSIGALYDVLNDNVLELLMGAKLSVDKLR